MRRNSKAILIFLNLLVFALCLRYIPFSRFVFQPSHWRFNIYSTIIITAQQGFIPPEDSLNSIASLRIAGHDSWPRLTFFAVIWEIIGFESRAQQELYLRHAVITPGLFAAATLTLSQVLNLSFKEKLMSAIVPLLGGHLMINGSMTGMAVFGYGASMIAWTFTSMIAYIYTRHKPWMFLTALFALMALSWRHTAGLVVLFSLVTMFLAYLFLPRFREGSKLRVILILIILVYLLHSFVIFNFFSSIAVSGLASILILLNSLGQSGSGSSSGGTGSGSGGAGSVTFQTPGTEIEVTLSHAIAAIDRIVLIALLTAVFLWAVHRVYRSIREKEALTRQEEVGICAASLSLGLGGAAIAFFIFKGSGGVLFRLSQYISVYALAFVPVLFHIDSYRPNDKLKNGVFAACLVLLLVSPSAILISDTYSSHSGWMTEEEKAGVDFAQAAVPQDNRIAGSYHTAPPIAQTHDNVVGYSLSRFGEQGLIKILIGLYKKPGPDTTPFAVTLLEEEYGHIDKIVLSTRESGDVGISIRNGKYGHANPGFTDEYPSSYNRVYSNDEYVIISR